MFTSNDIILFLEGTTQTNPLSMGDICYKYNAIDNEIRG